MTHLMKLRLETWLGVSGVNVLSSITGHLVTGPSEYKQEALHKIAPTCLGRKRCVPSGFSRALADVASGFSRKFNAGALFRLEAEATRAKGTSLCGFRLQP